MVIKKIVKAVCILLLVAILAVLVVELWYLPRYWFKRQKISTNNNTSDEITVMSCNVRCFSPTDLFKKSWFYRADLLSGDIAEVAPDVICFQEVQDLHYNYLKDVMPEYDSIVAFRDKSIIREGCAIFYRSDRFEKIDEVAEYNQMKVLNAMQECKVSDVHFAATTGYGYNDLGRDTLEEVYAKVFHTEDALVRPQLVSGTHALAIALSSQLRPGDELLSPVGKPYDTLEEVIGIRNSKGSLREYGISYKQVDLLEDGSFDFDNIAKAINDKTKLVTIQRSKGLGENDPDMMSLTTMNPSTRRLIKVEPSMAEETADKFDLLLGDNLAGRKDYIAENGHLYLDLTDVS